MQITEISIAAFKQIYNRGMSLIDVREVDEYEDGHIEGAINIPLSEFANRIGEVPKESVYFVCRSGGRSLQACEICVDAGLTRVINIAGGTMGWISAGNEIVVGGSPE